MSISLSTPLAQQAVPVKSHTIGGKAIIPLYIYGVALAALLTTVGIFWDIAWHRSIGRDKFLSPPHILIYLGAIFAGLFSGFQVVWNSFFASPAARPALIRVWGIFYSSLGALFCIWGALAMLTSAPFDDWWHNAYGLDVTILSPPHTLLWIGMIFLQLGSCVGITRYLNGTFDESIGAGEGAISYDRRRVILRILFAVSASSLLCMVYALFTDRLHVRLMRNISFYLLAAATSLSFLPAFSRALRMRWGMTAIAITYFFIVAGCNWVLQLFPAEPKLGPILTHITHFQPVDFPLLIVVPAILMDIILQRSKAGEWTKAVLLSLSFVSLLWVIEYPFSGFLLESPGARNWFFGAESWYYGSPPNSEWRYKFYPWEIASFPIMLAGLLLAAAVGTLCARLSLRLGNWLQSVQR